MKTKRRISLDKQTENTFVLVAHKENAREIHVGASRLVGMRITGLVISTHIRK